jgi:predicted TIM-barrel fold metal-dependent hydrolase
LAIDFAGVGQILAGSDYAHMIGSIPKMVQSIGSLSISKVDQEKILGRNAMGVYGIG